MSEKLKIKTYSIGIFSLVSVGYAFYLILLLIKNGIPNGFSEFGTLGDAFGTLNSLFSGLGFAGIVVTLFVQQHQIREQEKEYIQQDLRYQNDQYENTLHRYIELYKQILLEIYQPDENIEVFGRDILSASIKKTLESIRLNSTSFYPREIRVRYLSNELTREDKETIQFIHYEHHRLIKSNMVWQGRIIQTADLLFRHLEEKAPAGYDVSNSRELVMSQLTHIECQYFFLICLSTKKVSRMAQHMASSIFQLKNSKFKMSEIDRDLFEYAYKIKLNNAVVKDRNFIDASAVKKFRKRKKLIQARYRAMINKETLSK